MTTKPRTISSGGTEPDSRAARAAQRKGQRALGRAAGTASPTKSNVRELGAAAGEMRRALHGNSRYTPPGRAVRATS